MGYGFGGGYGGQCCGKVGGFDDYCNRGYGRNVSNFALLVVMFILLIIVGANIDFDNNKKRHHGKDRC